MLKTTEKKEIKYRRLPENDYKKFKKREKQLMRLKAFFRESWRILKQMK